MKKIKEKPNKGEIIIYKDKGNKINLNVRRVEQEFNMFHFGTGCNGW